PPTQCLLYNQTVQRMAKLRKNYLEATIIEKWEHDYDDELLVARVSGDIDETYPFHKLDTNWMTDRDIFYGGRVEVFDYFNMADLAKGEELKYLEIISHYPNICGFETLCTGHPQRLFGPEI